MPDENENPDEDQNPDADQNRKSFFGGIKDNIGGNSPSNKPLAKLDQRFNRIAAGGSLPNRAVLGIWHLATNDKASLVESSGYFNNFAGVLEVGEPIMASMSVGSRPVLKFYIVTINDGQTVKIAAAS